MRGSGFPNNENHHLEFESYRLLLGLDSREFPGIGDGKSREISNENHHLSSPADVHLEFESYRLLLGLDFREFPGIGNGKSRENSNENDYLSSPSDASGI